MAKLRYIGHSSFQVEYNDGTILYIDPYFSAEGRDLPPALKDAHGIKKCDLIFITHEHHDHFEPDAVVEIAERTWATVIGPSQVTEKLPLSQKVKVAVNPGDRFQMKGVSVEVVKAVHPQSDNPVGYIIEKDGLRIYNSGDTYEFMEMADIHCDWALIPIGGTYTMDVIGAEKAAKEIKAKYFVPTHYNTWARIAQDGHEFAKTLIGTGKKTVLLRPGQEVELIQ